MITNMCLSSIRIDNIAKNNGAQLESQLPFQLIQGYCYVKVVSIVVNMLEIEMDERKGRRSIHTIPLI